MPLTPGLSPFADSQAAINTYLAIGNGASPQIFNIIANVQDLTGPSLSATEVDITTHSTADPWRRKTVTLLDAGQVSCPLIFIPSSGGPTLGYLGHNNATGLLNIFTNRRIEDYQMQFPDSALTTWTFKARISKYNIDAKVAGVLMAQVTFSLTGMPSFA